MKKLQTLAVKAGIGVLTILHFIFSAGFVLLLVASGLGMVGTMAADFADPVYAGGEVIEYANGVTVSTVHVEDRIDRVMPIIIGMFLACLLSLALAFGTDALRWRLQRQLAP